MAAVPAAQMKKRMTTIFLCNPSGKRSSDPGGLNDCRDFFYYRVKKIIFPLEKSRTVYYITRDLQGTGLQQFKQRSQVKH